MLLDNKCAANDFLLKWLSNKSERADTSDENFNQFTCFRSTELRIQYTMYFKCVYLHKFRSFTIIFILESADAAETWVDDDM